MKQIFIKRDYATVHAIFEPRRHSLLRYQFGKKKKQQIKQNFGSHNTVQCTNDVPSMTPTLSIFKTREFRHVPSMIILA